MENQQAKVDKQLHWFGGILDGEGSFMMVKEHRKWKTKAGIVEDFFFIPAIKLCNTDANGLKDVVSILDLIKLPYYISWRKGTKNWKSSWMVEIKGIKRCLHWCETLKQYIVWKQKELEAMQDFCVSRLERELESRGGFNSHQRFPKYNERELKSAGILRGRRIGTRLI